MFLVTEREAQILNWIAENPMISQQELAEKAHITRSSVAVHISNLVKKGKIKGKGYVIVNNDYVSVVGAINIDIAGTPFKKNIHKDSNPGTITTKLGGVGRNIAENLVRLGITTELITSFGDDHNSSNIYESCQNLGLSIQHSIKIPHQSTSTYLCLNDVDGNMQLAISDMEIYENITPNFIAKRLKIINNGSVCVVDTNIPKDTIEYLADSVKVPLFVDPVSGVKSEKLMDCIGQIHTITPNIIELSKLTGMKIETKEDMGKACSYLINKGVKQIFLTIGKQGVYYTNGKKQGFIPPYETDVVNTTGAGDSFMAGVVWGYMNDKNIRECAKIGEAMAALTVKTNAHVSEEISEKNILSIIENN